MQFFSDTSGFLGQNALIIVLILVFASVTFLVVASAWILTGRSVIQKRLDPGSTGSRRGGNAPPLSIRFEDDSVKVLKFFKPLYEPFVPKEQDFVGSVKTELVQAGYLHPSAVSMYFGTRIILAVGLGLAGLILSPIFAGNIAPNKAVLLAVIFSLGGYFFPQIYMKRRRNTRRRLIQEGFPDALDLLLVCVEAGQALDAAIAQVATEIDKAHPILAEHFRLVGAELRAGRSRQDALRSLGERTGVEDVRTLVSLLVQSDELGTSISQALRVHAFEMRATRILRAEEKAHKIPVKLAFPLMLGLIPVVLLVTLTPAIIKMIEFLLPALQRTSVFSGGG
jgi:tight adherence protein C